MREREYILSSDRYSALSLSFHTSPVLTVVKATQTNVTETYSRSWRLQPGCRKTSHRSFTPSSCSWFDARSRCVRLLLLRREDDRCSLLPEVKWQRRSLQEGQCEENGIIAPVPEIYILEKISCYALYLHLIKQPLPSLPLWLSHFGNIGLHQIGLQTGFVFFRIFIIINKTGYKYSILLQK